MPKIRQAFTMIELIFVIVIIGILASVALPKLAATRDDAQVTYVLANTKQLIDDVYSYYTSKGNANFKVALSQDITTAPISIRNDCKPLGSGTRSFITSTLHLCVEGVSVLKIETGNVADKIFKMKLSANNVNKPIGKILQHSKVFQKFTNGISGKEYIINSAKVNRD